MVLNFRAAKGKVRFSCGLRVTVGDTQTRVIVMDTPTASLHSASAVRRRVDINPGTWRNVLQPWPPLTVQAPPGTIRVLPLLIWTESYGLIIFALWNIQVRIMGRLESIVPMVCVCQRFRLLEMPNVRTGGDTGQSLCLRVLRG